VIASDLDGDGILDLAVTCPDAAKVHVYLGEKGAFSALPPLDLPGTNPDAAAAGEVDGDGKSDLVVANVGGGTVLLLRGKGDGSFEDAVEIGKCGGASSVVLADPDGDGLLDIAASCTLWDAVLALRSSGAGSWDPTLYESGRLPVTLAAADLTGDGRGDLAAGDSGSRGITVLPADGPEPPAGLFRRGEVSNDGRLDISDAVQTLLFLFGGGREPACRDAADATDDGSVDITDPIYTLNYLFLGGREIPAPGPSACGPDETADGLPECVEPCAA
jgi:VCBS repeat protein